MSVETKLQSMLSGYIYGKPEFVDNKLLTYVKPILNNDPETFDDDMLSVAFVHLNTIEGKMILVCIMSEEEADYNFSDKFEQIVGAKIQSYAINFALGCISDHYIELKN